MGELFCIVAFLTGAFITILFLLCRKPQPKRIRPRASKDKLDSVDDMVLWGEVNNDPFYDII